MISAPPPQLGFVLLESKPPIYYDEILSSGLLRHNLQILFLVQSQEIRDKMDLPQLKLESKSFRG
jgi:hypothetical protein